MRLALPCALLLTAACWSGVPWGTFQFDDFLNVVRDEATRDVGALFERLPHGLRPLTRLSFFLDAHLFGMHAAGFLTINLLLHLATTALVFALARRRVTPLAAFLAALCFALQPTNAEVVAYVSGRSTGLMTPLLLGGLLLHDRGQRTLAYVLFVLACLAKEVALIFPLLLLVWEATRMPPREGVGRETGPHAAVWREVALAAVLAVAITAALFAFAGYRSMLSWSLAFRSIGDNLLANGRAIPIMLSLWVRPWALSPDHDFDDAGHLVASITGLAVLSALLVAAFTLRRCWPMLALALAWPLISLLPTNSLIAKIDLVTEKPLYLAWVGPAIALGAGAGAVILGMRGKGARRLSVSACVVVLCALAGATIWRASLWRDPVLLWTDAVAKAPAKSRCWNNLGMAQLAVHADVDAVATFERARALDPANETARLNVVTARTLCGHACTSQ